MSLASRIQHISALLVFDPVYMRFVISLVCDPVYCGSILNMSLVYGITYSTSLVYNPVH